jgi:hypothetical protein
MYGVQIANLYFRHFFKRPFWRRHLKMHSNVTLIENDISMSPFSKDAELLKKTYREGLEKGNELLARL